MDMEIVLLLNFTNVTLNSLPGGNSCVTQGKIMNYYIYLIFLFGRFNYNNQSLNENCNTDHIRVKLNDGTK